MKQEYRPALVKITSLMQEMDLVALKHGVTYYYWVVKKFDLDKQDEINSICEEYNLEWELKPQPEKITNGKPTYTKFKLNSLGYKKRPMLRAKLPLEIARAKLTVRAKRKKR